MRILARIVPPGTRSLSRGLAPSILCGTLAGAVVVVQAALLCRATDLLARRGLLARLLALQRSFDALGDGAFGVRAV